MSKMNYFGQLPHFNFGEVVYNKCGRYGPRLQRNLQLVYILEGEATIYVDGCKRRLGPREISLLLPGHKEDFRFSTTGKTRHGWCEVLDAKLEPQLRILYEKLSARQTPFTKRMAQLAQLGTPLVDHSLPSELRLVNALGQAFFFEFFREVNLFEAAVVHGIPESVRRTREHVERNYHLPCNLDSLSKLAGVTPAHLIRLFRKHHAVTPINFLWQTRVEAGRRLLLESGLSVAEIAYRSGFQSPYHFSRLIRKHLGLSPNKYRKQSWSRT